MEEEILHCTKNTVGWRENILCVESCGIRLYAQKEKQQRGTQKSGWVSAGTQPTLSRCQLSRLSLQQKKLGLLAISSFDL